MDQGEANEDIIDQNSAKYNEPKPWNLRRPADFGKKNQNINMVFKTSKLISSRSCLELDSVEAYKDIIALFDVKEIDSKAITCQRISCK